MDTSIDLINSVLQKVWLDKTQSQVFSYCLQYGPVSISTLSRLTKIPRSTLYGVIERLMKIAYIIEHTWGKWTTYSAIQTHEIVALLDNKKNDIEKQIECVKNYKAQIDFLQKGNKKIPLVSYYTNNEVTTIMYDKIKQSDFVRSIRDIEWAMKFYGLSFEEVSTWGRVSKGITKRILYDSPAARKYKKSHQTKKYQIKLLPAQEGMKSDMMIMDGSVYHGSYGDRPVGIEISDPYFYQIQSLMFDRLWESL